MRLTPLVRPVDMRPAETADEPDEEPGADAAETNDAHAGEPEPELATTGAGAPAKRKGRMRRFFTKGRSPATFEDYAYTLMDEGYAISYKLLERGTAVHASDGQPVGRVERVLENPREHIFDGIVIATERGLRFVDAPEVGRIAERLVTLTIDATEAAALPEPDPGAPEFKANTSAGRLSRFFGGAWRRK